MLAVELLILLVGMAGTQELQVRLADDVGTYIAQQTLDGGLWYTALAYWRASS